MVETDVPLITPEQTPKELRTIGFYSQALAKDLPAKVFERNPLRLLWYGGLAVGSIAAFSAIVFLHLPWPVKIGLGLFLGFCNGTMAFVSHELFHGSIVKSTRAQTILGFFGAIPFFISPTFWRYWHNRLHHGRTQQLIRDPDAFPNLKIYKNSPFVKFIYPYTPGSGHKRSVLYFFFWFSYHNFVAQLYLRFRNKIFDSLDQKKVTLEFAGQIAIAGVLLAIAGPRNWPFVILCPLVVQNYLLMSYISTNHNLSPLTTENDPLVNSLTVTNWKPLEFLNMNFGYHVEHHIFPSVNGKYAKDIHKALVRTFPETYLVMPKWKAVKALYSTSRIYKNANELINPYTLKTYPTLKPTSKSL